MKNLSILLLFLSPYLTIAQIEGRIDKNENSEYYINSEKADLDNTFINNNSIESFTVLKKENGKQYYIKLKKGVVLDQLNSLDFQNEKTLENKIYFLNNEVIRDPSIIKIDKNAIETTEIISSSEIANISETFSIINIKTYSSKQNFEKGKTFVVKNMETGKTFELKSSK